MVVNSTANIPSHHTLAADPVGDHGVRDVEDLCPKTRARHHFLTRSRIAIASDGRTTCPDHLLGVERLAAGRGPAGWAGAAQGTARPVVCTPALPAARHHCRNWGGMQTMVDLSQNGYV